MRQYTFKKEERLKCKKSIDILFRESDSLRVYPVAVLYRRGTSNGSAGHQVLFTVPRRRIKKASDRNTIRRRLREAYRVEKKVLGDCPVLWIGFIYSPNKIVSYECIHRGVRRAVGQLKEVRECLADS